MALIKCSECSAEISDKAARCPKCGAPVITHKWRCSNCGNMISEEPCSYCSGENNNLSHSTKVYAENAGSEVVKIQDNKAKVIWIILGVIVTVLIIVTISLNGGNTGSNSSQNNSHSNCMFIGYADPNKPLNGNSHVVREPQYGYRPVYVDRDDIYNTYHFH